MVNVGKYTSPMDPMGMASTVQLFDEPGKQLLLLISIN